MNFSSVIISKSHEPACNLAFEEYLIQKSKEVLFLWQNEPTVVIGRNQNPYRECSLKAIKDDGVHLVRRRSGGGAVYHDLGNLNFTIITEKSPECLEKNWIFLNEVLKRLGISAKLSGRNDIEIDGKKISGNAFFENENIFCQHGTLLISSDLSVISKYLNASKLKLKSKGIESVRARVANLCDFAEDITVSKVITAFCEEANAKAEYAKKEDILKIADVERNIKRYNSWDWTMGESPEFNMLIEEKFSNELLSAEILLESGKISECKIFSDSLENIDFTPLSQSLKGVNFRFRDIKPKILMNIKSQKERENLVALFKKIEY